MPILIFSPVQIIITHPLVANVLLFLDYLRHINFCLLYVVHGLRTPSEEIAFTARPKIKSQSQIYRYSRSIFCLPHRPKISDFFKLCLRWVSVVRVVDHTIRHNQTQWHKVNYLDFCFVFKCLHISNSRTNPEEIDF